MIMGRELVKYIEERYFPDSLVLRGPLGAPSLCSNAFIDPARSPPISVQPRRIVNRAWLALKLREMANAYSIA